MTKYALIQAGVVENIVIAAPDFVANLAGVTPLSVTDDVMVTIDSLYDGSAFTLPTPPRPPVAVYEWYIDTGAFFDRFGNAKTALLTSNDIGVQGLVRDFRARKWIVLKDPELASAIDYLQDKVAGITPTLKDSIINRKVSPAENLDLRKNYFS